MDPIASIWSKITRTEYMHTRTLPKPRASLSSPSHPLISRPAPRPLHGCQTRAPSGRTLGALAPAIAASSVIDTDLLDQGYAGVGDIGCGGGGLVQA